MTFSLACLVVTCSYFGFQTIVDAQVYQRPDNFALLSATLRTYQTAGCDNDIVTLKCPAGTSISVQIAQYGKSSSHGLCSSKQMPSSLVPDVPQQTVCLLPNTIQTVVEACQQKRQCKFQTSPTTFGGDPCPGLPKYVEVAYKCRPDEFRSKMACENDKILLRCNPNSRIAVYSSSYGRTPYESIQCPQPQGVPEETCLASYATETVMHLCHGKRNCDISADVSTFGSPCKPQSRMYLRVAYTCVPRRVLKDQYDAPLEPDESPEDERDNDVYDIERENIRESAVSPASPNLVENSSNDNTTNVEAGFLPTNFYGLQFEIHKNYVIFFVVSVVIATVLLLSFLVGRFLFQKHRNQREAKFYTASISDHTLANGFTDDISEVDVDIDLQTTLPMTTPSVTIHPVPMGTIAEVVRYPEYPRHMHPYSQSFPADPNTILEGNIVPAKTMRAPGTSQYYYG
ncbi:protein eva-1 homolog C-like isoform X2 [Sitophilus oryzae]|uniref:Protein eva-1 homolog C-like isoform X2 n=1 Tax=Sitophilus oryzae TaxID=7048 RepID=A0A6J2XC48_SITOR|nr:protein eva-1 homolog C-like isoform X2 [Sitophilus oryzae]